jgi:hypothetical protein
MRAKASAWDLAAEFAFLIRALKAPTLRESVGWLAERARAENWSYEEFLVACLQRGGRRGRSRAGCFVITKLRPYGDARSRGRCPPARRCTYTTTGTASPPGTSPRSSPM